MQHSLAVAALKYLWIRSADSEPRAQASDCLSSPALATDCSTTKCSLQEKNDSRRAPFESWRNITHATLVMSGERGGYGEISLFRSGSCDAGEHVRGGRSQPSAAGDAGRQSHRRAAGHANQE